MDNRDTRQTAGAVSPAVGSEPTRRRRRAVGVVGMVFALALGACSGGGSQAPAGSAAGGAGASTGAAASAAAGGSSDAGASGAAGGSAAAGGSGTTGKFQAPTGNVQLALWNAFTGPDGNFFNKIVQQFNAANPNVQVTVKTQPGAEYTQRLEAALSANQLPDVVALGYDQLAQLTEEQIIVPVGDFAQTGGYGPDLFPKAVWDAAQWKNQTMGIPFDTHPMILFYNKKLFKDAGLDPEKAPTDTASFEAAIKAVKDKTGADGLQMVASGPGANFLVGLVWATLFYQGGGQWTSPDFAQATINSDAGVQASTYLAHLVKDLGVKKVESDAELNAFLQGKNAMMFNGPWQLTAAQDALKDDLGVALVPKFFGDGDWAGSHDLSLTAGAKDGDKKTAAYFFMDWFTNHSLDWAASGQVPALNSVRQQLDGKTDGVLPYIAQIAPLADQVRFLPNIPGGGDILFVANGAGEAGTLAINGTDPKGALDKAAQYNTQVLQQNKERYGY